VGLAEHGLRELARFAGSVCRRAVIWKEAEIARETEWKSISSRESVQRVRGVGEGPRTRRRRFRRSQGPIFAESP
jgi:hypothetical protein